MAAGASSTHAGTLMAMRMEMAAAAAAAAVKVATGSKVGNTATVVSVETAQREDLVPVAVPVVAPVDVDLGVLFYG